MKRIKIAFIGSDGSGKTTLISNIKKQLEKEGKTAEVFFLGWRNFRNPILNFFSKVYLKEKIKKNADEEKLARFRERSWFFYLIYYSELWLRYLNILFSKKDYILIDRYFYDELAFARGGKFKFFKLITPLPNFCFLLKSPLKIINSRQKQKISKERFEYFYNNLENLSKSFAIIRIDTSKPINKTSKKVIAIIKASRKKSEPFKGRMNCAIYLF